MEYTGEIERLRRDLLAAREKNGVFLSEENYQAMENSIIQGKAQIKELEKNIEAVTGEMQKLTELLEFTQQKLKERTEELEITTKNLEDTTNTLHRTEKDMSVTTQDRDEQKYLVSEHFTNEAQLMSEAKEEMHEDITCYLQGLLTKRNAELAADNGKRLTTEHQASSDSFGTTVDAQLTDLTDTISGWVSKRQEEVNTMSQWTEKMEGSAEKELARVERFLAEDLREDVPTGTTPQRRPFTYPRDLACTEPHDLLIKKFQVENKLTQITDKDESKENFIMPKSVTTNRGKKVPRYRSKNRTPTTKSRLPLRVANPAN